VPSDPETPGQCDPKDENAGTPLNAFIAMPGDKIQLVGKFTSILDGDNIAAILSVKWADANLSSGLIGDYTVSVPSPDGDDPLLSVGDSVGKPVKLVTVANSTPDNERAEGTVVLEPGIHEASTITWDVIVSIEVKHGDTNQNAYQYDWRDPKNVVEADPKRFTVPGLNFTLDQVRSGAGWGGATP
jgi:hypothetical protein